MRPGEVMQGFVEIKGAPAMTVRVAVLFSKGPCFLADADVIQRLACYCAAVRYTTS